jgi:hypothetical protein
MLVVVMVPSVKYRCTIAAASRPLLLLQQQRILAVHCALPEDDHVKGDGAEAANDPRQLLLQLLPSEGAQDDAGARAQVGTDRHDEHDQGQAFAGFAAVILVYLADAAAQVQDAGNIPQPCTYNEGPVVLLILPNSPLPSPSFATRASATATTTAAAAVAATTCRGWAVKQQGRLQVHTAALLLLQARLHRPG